jgi:hypothetical protein
LAGIAKYLAVEDVTIWLDPLVRSIISPSTSDNLRKRIERYLAEEASAETSGEVDAAIDKRLDQWIRRLAPNPDQVAAVEGLKAAIEAHRFPF